MSCQIDIESHTTKPLIMWEFRVGGILRQSGECLPRLLPVVLASLHEEILKYEGWTKSGRAD